MHDGCTVGDLSQANRLRRAGVGSGHLPDRADRRDRARLRRARRRPGCVRTTTVAPGAARRGDPGARPRSPAAKTRRSKPTIADVPTAQRRRGAGPPVVAPTVQQTAEAPTQTRAPETGARRRNAHRDAGPRASVSAAPRRRRRPARQAPSSTATSASCTVTSCDVPASCDARRRARPATPQRRPSSTSATDAAIGTADDGQRRLTRAASAAATDDVRGARVRHRCRPTVVRRRVVRVERVLDHARRESRAVRVLVRVVLASSSSSTAEAAQR